MDHTLRCISDYGRNSKVKKRIIISRRLEVKLCHKLFANFQQRYVALIYVEKKINENVVTGHYQIEIHKNKIKDKSVSLPLFSLPLNPISMRFYINHLNSNKHQFTFVCSSNGTSICLNAHTNFERNSWISVLQHLQWQYQTNMNQKQTPLECDNNTNKTDDIDDIHYEQESDDQYNKTLRIEDKTTIPNKYKNTNLWKANNFDKSCECDICSAKKYTILGLLNNEYGP